MTQIKAGVNAKISELSPEAAAQFDTNSFALRGTVLLTSLSNYGEGAGIAPLGMYSGFIVGGAGVTISSITYEVPSLHNSVAGENINSLGLVAGLFYPLEGITTLTITAGALLLIKTN